MADEKVENRRAPRIEILGELQGEVMVFEPMTITDISRTGAQVETTVPLRLNSLHDFRLQLGDRSLVVKGRIVHARISDVADQATLYRAGVEFVQPPDRITEAIREFVDAIVAGRGKA
jgi:PilZ domain